MNLYTQVLIPALVSLLVALISHPLVVRMRIKHEENLALLQIRKEKLHNWKIYISNLIYEGPLRIEEFRNTTTYLDIEIELPKKTKERIKNLILQSNYRTRPTDLEIANNSNEITQALEEVLSDLAKLGKIWKIQ